MIRNCWLCHSLDGMGMGIGGGGGNIIIITVTSAPVIFVLISYHYQSLYSHLSLCGQPHCFFNQLHFSSFSLVFLPNKNVFYWVFFHYRLKISSTYLLLAIFCLFIFFQLLGLVSKRVLLIPILFFYLLLSPKTFDTFSINCFYYFCSFLLLFFFIVFSSFFDSYFVLMIIYSFIYYSFFFALFILPDRQLSNI